MSFPTFLFTMLVELMRVPRPPASQGPPGSGVSGKAPGTMERAPASPKNTEKDRCDAATTELCLCSVRFN